MKNYYRAMGIARAIGEFAGPIALRHRLAYGRPVDLDDDVVWRTGTQDLPRLRDAVRDAMSALRH